MKKLKEASDPKSCWNRAEDEELVFVLLARDPAAPQAILAWINERIRLGKNTQGDAQVIEATKCALNMHCYSELRKENTATARRKPNE
jgi:hypothetical protein